MKRIITLMSAAVLALGANAQTITISSIDQTLANDYAGGCEIDLNNDGLKEIIISGKPQWSAAPGRIIEDADGNEVSSDFQSWVLTYNGTSYDKKEFSQLVGLLGVLCQLLDGLRPEGVPVWICELGLLRALLGSGKLAGPGRLRVSGL